MARMPAATDIIVPIVSAAIGTQATCGSWLDKITPNTLPLINIRRDGGVRDETHPFALSNPIVAIDVFHAESVAKCLDLYDTALDALFDAVASQTTTSDGHLSSIVEILGPSQVPSPFRGAWAVEGRIRVGLRPPR